jgi:hypothetical protein
MFFLKPKAWRQRRAPIFSYSGPSRDLSEPIKDENNNEGVGEKREDNSKFSQVVWPNMIAVTNIAIALIPRVLSNAWLVALPDICRTRTSHVR